jgi:hypothetical protein
MRRSLRKIDPQEVHQYDETEQLFTVDSLEEARQRLTHDGLDPAAYCFFTWMREGVRYYRVYEDKRVRDGIIRTVPFGTPAARLKRADAEKLYTVTKRYSGQAVQILAQDGQIRLSDPQTGTVKLSASLPLVGGDLIFEPAEWSERQAAHFFNVILVRGQHVDVAFEESETLRIASLS